MIRKISRQRAFELSPYLRGCCAGGQREAVESWQDEISRRRDSIECLHEVGERLASLQELLDESERRAPGSRKWIEQDIVAERELLESLLRQGSRDDRLAGIREIELMLADRSRWDALRFPGAMPVEWSYLGLTIGDRQLEGYPSRLAGRVVALASRLHTAHWVLSQTTSGAWPHRDTGYGPLSGALATLRELGVEDGYRDALLVDAEGMREVLPPLFWLTRCLPEAGLFFTSLRRETIRVTQTRSTIGHPAHRRAVLKGLGLRRIGHSVVVDNRPSFRGMVKKVLHLVRVDEAWTWQLRLAKYGGIRLSVQSAHAKRFFRAAKEVGFELGGRFLGEPFSEGGSAIEGRTIEV